MSNRETTVGELMELLDRTQKSLAEEGTHAHRVDALAIVVRPDGQTSLRFVDLVPSRSDDVLDKAIGLDPAFEKGRYPREEDNDWRSR